MRKQFIIKSIFAVWIILWLVFLFRENKAGQYKTLWYMYTHNEDDRLRHVYGDTLYELLTYCKSELPENYTYELCGFKKFSIAEVMSRYFLWPGKDVIGEADFKIYYGGLTGKLDYEYSPYIKFSGAGSVFIRKGTES